MKNFQTNYCISLWNSVIDKKTSKQTTSLNSENEVENTELALVEEGIGAWEISSKTILLARNQMSNQILLQIIKNKINIIFLREVFSDHFEPTNILYINWYSTTVVILWSNMWLLYELNSCLLPDVCPLISMYQLRNPERYININIYLYRETGSHICMHIYTQTNTHTHKKLYGPFLWISFN